MSDGKAGDGGSFWTQERDEELLRMSQTLRGEALARHFGVTASYCRVRLRKLRGHVKQPRAPEPVQQQSRVYQRVRDRVTAAADQRRGFTVPAEKQAEYLELLKSGLPIAEVRRRLNL